MANFKKVQVNDAPRTELHEALNLTGAEVTVNVLPQGASVPFVHAHKDNEEIYVILEGEGKAVIDGETVNLVKGDYLSIAPQAKRQFFAGETSSIKYICIQVKSNSLVNYTATDAIIY